MYANRQYLRGDYPSIAEARVALLDCGYRQVTRDRASVYQYLHPGSRDLVEIECKGMLHYRLRPVAHNYGGQP